MSSTLGLWMNGELVGHWRVDRGASTLTYASTWLQSDKVRSLSLSLPITASREIRGPVVTNFFDNLLPDNESIRERLARRFRTKDAQAFTPAPMRKRTARRSCSPSWRSGSWPRQTGMPRTTRSSWAGATCTA